MKSICIGAIAALAAATAFAQQTDAGDSATWYLIAADDGAVLGHASLETAPTEGGRDVIETQEIYLREQGGEPMRLTARSVRSEDAAGRTIALSETRRTARFTSRTEARVSGDSVHVVWQTPSGRWSDVVALPPAVRFDGGEALLRGWDPGASPRLEFESFNMDAMAVERVVIEAVAREEGRVAALLTRFDGDELRGVARLVLDGEGRLVEVAQPMFGETIRTRVSDRATALRPHPPFQVVPNLMTRSPFRISALAAQGHIRYRFAFRDGIAFAPPQTGEQRVSVAADGVTFDICAACGPGLRADDEALAEALRPTAWLQSDAPRLREIAGPVARLDVSDARKMELLLDRARPYLENFDFNGHYSALDTVTRRAGDCTEAAVLLAALGRAAGIPTRVASGLAYSRAAYHGVSNAFLPHSWTLAYVDGAWRSFDLALEEFDSTHIALTVGDGDARSIAAAGQLASLLRLDGLAEVRPRS